MKDNLFLALLLSTCLNAANSFNLTILHNNDMHARFEEFMSEGGKKVGGFARTAYMVKEERKKALQTNTSLLFLNAGDTYTGTVWYSVYKWKIVKEFMNALHPDVMCLGNHEFDDNIEGLVPFIEESTFPIVSANLNLTFEPSLKNSKLQASVILDVNGHKVGVIGYLTPDTKRYALNSNVIFEDEIGPVRRESEKLHKLGVKIIIALGHSGYLMDQKIARDIPLVDVVVGGHTNTFLWNGPKPDVEIPEGPYPKVITQRGGKKVPVVQAYAYTKYLGRLELEFDEQGDLKSFSGQPIYMDEHIPQDSDILNKLDTYRPTLKTLDDDVIGVSKVYLDGEGCRSGECNFGNLVVDSFVAYKANNYDGRYWTDTPIAIINSGAIRGGINVTERNGNVTKADILGVFPFFQSLVTVELLGQDLRDILEVSVHSNGETSRGEFLQMSGLHVVYNMSKPPGSRVVSLKARCGECDVPHYNHVDNQRIYRVVLTAFLTNGGDGYDVVKAKSLSFTTDDTKDFDAVLKYIRTKKVLVPEIEERITIHNGHSSAQKVRLSSTVLFILFLNLRLL